MTRCGVNIIGAGLAGCEAAYQLARRGVKVCLFDIKPKSFTSAHSSPYFAELVCSNSLKSDELTNACGLLKQEMREIGSLIMSCADMHRVPAGSALAVDREKFTREVTERIKGFDNIHTVCREVTSIESGAYTIIASGPLTTPALAKEIMRLSGAENLYFFDAAAPIVDGSTIDMERAFMADRYGKGGGDYLNCPMDEEEYYAFVKELASAQTVKLKDFEDDKVFEGCVPIEVMARRSPDSLRFGPLRPVGLAGKDGKMPLRRCAASQGKPRGKLLQHGGLPDKFALFRAKEGFLHGPRLKERRVCKVRRHA